MDKKYIFANIRLPIELSEDGSLLEIYNDRMTVDFELCSSLPDLTSYDNKELIAQILGIHKKKDDANVNITDEANIADEDIPINSTTELKKENEEEETDDDDDTDDDDTDDEEKVNDDEEKYNDKEKEETVDVKVNIKRLKQNISFKNRTKSSGSRRFTQRR